MTEKEMLIEKAEGLGIDVEGLTIPQLKEAIAAAEEAVGGEDEAPEEPIQEVEGLKTYIVKATFYDGKKKTIAGEKIELEPREAKELLERELIKEV